MKKALLILLCIIPVSIFAGCAENSASSRNNDDKSDVEKVLEAGMNNENASTDSNGDNAGTSAKSAASSAPAEGVDVDLTVMSSTMVYSEVLNMMTNPDDYVGKVIKMEGIYATYHDDASGNDYYACIIQDATACCAQGIEFVLADGNYPESNDQTLSVVGTFDTYDENGTKYCTLRNAQLV